MQRRRRISPSAALQIYIKNYGESFIESGSFYGFIFRLAGLCRSLKALRFLYKMHAFEKYG